MKTGKKITGTIAFSFRQVLLYLVLNYDKNIRTLKFEICLDWRTLKLETRSAGKTYRLVNVTAGGKRKSQNALTG